MDITEQDRLDLAARLQREQAVRFGGIAKAAYVAAGVNSATWARVTSGQSVKPHKLHQIVVSLWPETEGDWTQIPEPGTEPARVTPANVDTILTRLDAIEARLDGLEGRPETNGPHLSAVAKEGKIEEPGEFD